MEAGVQARGEHKEENSSRDLAWVRMVPSVTPAPRSSLSPPQPRFQHQQQQGSPFSRHSDSVLSARSIGMISSLVSPSWSKRRVNRGDRIARRGSGGSYSSRDKRDRYQNDKYTVEEDVVRPGYSGIWDAW